MAAWDASLDHLVREHGTALLRYGYLLCGQQSEAEDLVQEAILRTFVAGRRTMDPATAEAYVRRSMLNIYIDGFRRRRRWAAIRHLLVTEEVGSEVESSGSTEADIERALTAVPPRQRACVVLRFYEDQTIGVIADQLGLSQGSVRRYLSDGMARMGAVLEVEIHDEPDGDEAGLDIFTGRRTR